MWSVLDIAMKQIALLMVLLFLIAACTTPVEPTQEVEEPEPTIEVKETVVEEKLKAIEEKIGVVEDKIEDVEESKVDKPIEPTVIIKSGEKDEQEAESEVPPAPMPTQPEASFGEMDDDIKYLLGRADEKIKSYKFTYAAPPLNLARDVWYIKGTRLKVDLFEENWVTLGEYFDTIFIDTAKKTAVGYCQSPKTTRCADAKERYEQDYEEVMITTPYQWVKQIPNQVEKVSTEMLWDRKVTVLKYMLNGKEYKQWIDNFAGLPLKVQEKQEGKDPIQWGFRYLSVNSVSDDDLEFKKIYQLINEN